MSHSDYGQLQEALLHYNLIFKKYIKFFLPYCLSSKSLQSVIKSLNIMDYYRIYEGWNFNSDNYLFTTDTK